MKAKFEVEIKTDVGFKLIKFTKEEAKSMGLLKDNKNVEQSQEDL